MSNIAPDTWTKWINILEEILHDADVGSAHEFAVHVDSAILAAHELAGTERAVMRHDQLSSEERQS